MGIVVGRGSGVPRLIASSLGAMKPEDRIVLF